MQYKQNKLAAVFAAKVTDNLIRCELLLSLGSADPRTHTRCPGTDPLCCLPREYVAGHGGESRGKGGGEGGGRWWWWSSRHYHAISRRTHVRSASWELIRVWKPDATSAT